MFVADYDDGSLYQYTIKTPISPDSPVELVNTFTGAKNPRCVRYWRERDELYVGHDGGKLVVFELNNFTSGPICSMKQHGGDITGLKIIDGDGTIVTSAKEKEMKVSFFVKI